MMNISAMISQHNFRLFGFFQKVKATPLNASTSTVLPRPEPSTSEAKQKERQPIVEDEHVAANTDQGGKISNKPSQKPKVKPRFESSFTFILS
jgi:hypothetical protein